MGLQDFIKSYAQQTKAYEFYKILNGIGEEYFREEAAHALLEAERMITNSYDCTIKTLTFEDDSVLTIDLNAESVEYKEAEEDSLAVKIVRVSKIIEEEEVILSLLQLTIEEAISVDKFGVFLRFTLPDESIVLYKDCEFKQA